jgi:hypothetical protein
VNEHRVLLLLFAAMVSTLTACSSPWKATFEPAGGPGDARAFAPTERVIIREVPWARVDNALRVIDANRAASDVHPDELTDAQRTEERAMLATALQLSEDPADLAFLGRCVFTTTSNVDLLDGSLSRFARSIGADYAIWSNTFVGRAQAIEREAVTSTGWGWTRHYRRDGRVDYDLLPYNETTYVPIVVERDKFAWVVYFVRVLDE